MVYLVCLPLTHWPARPRAKASQYLSAYAEILFPGAGEHPGALVFCEKSTKSTKSLMARPQNDTETTTGIKKTTKTTTTTQQTTTTIKKTTKHIKQQQR